MSHYHLSQEALIGEDIRLGSCKNTYVWLSALQRAECVVFFHLSRTSLSHGKDGFGGTFIHVARKQHALLPFQENLNPTK